MADGGTGEMRVLIVDDEELARLRIRKYLETRHPELRLAEAEDGVDALARIKDFAPDVVFLDVEMPGLTGFEVLRQLETRSFQVVFQTAYDQFAIQAFDANACDYVLKPFNDERLEKALTKALGAARAAKAAAPAPDAAVVDPLAKLDQALVAGGRYLERFVVTVGSRSRVVEAAEVLYFLSESHVTRIMLEGIDFAYDHSLTYLEERLDPARFVRVHRNAIVALSKVATVVRGEKASVTLKNGVELPVSRERKPLLLKALEGGG
jgi:two-component system LytT family response regulator